MAHSNVLCAAALSKERNSPFQLQGHAVQHGLLTKRFWICSTATKFMRVFLLTSRDGPIRF